MTAELSQIALEFAKRCMGWVSAEQTAESHIWNGGFRGESKGFCFTDLRVVMDAVRAWLPVPSLSLEYDGIGFTAFIEISRGHYINGGANPSPCHALLSACVEAAKKLEAA